MEADKKKLTRWLQRQKPSPAIDSKPRDGQRWYYSIRNNKLRYCQARKNGTFGPWRKVGDDIWYEIQEGSGLPQNLFHDLQDRILDPVMKITREKRTFGRVLKAMPHGLHEAAKLLGCDAAKEREGLFRFYRKGKPSMEFMVVDFHHHEPDKFFKKDKDGVTVVNRKKLPRRDLGLLSDELRKRKRFKITRWEQRSPATFRWLIVVFAPSLRALAERNVWLVPAKSLHRFPREG